MDGRTRAEKLRDLSMNSAATENERAVAAKMLKKGGWSPEPPTARNAGPAPQTHTPKSPTTEVQKQGSGIPTEYRELYNHVHNARANRDRGGLLGLFFNSLNGSSTSGNSRYPEQNYYQDDGPTQEELEAQAAKKKQEADDAYRNLAEQIQRDAARPSSVPQSGIKYEEVDNPGCLSVFFGRREKKPTKPKPETDPWIGGGTGMWDQH